MSEFGTDYRNVVDKTVGGEVHPKSSQAKTTSIAVAGKSTQILDPKKRSTSKALLDIATTIGTGIGTRQQQEAYNESFRTATQEGLDEMQANEGFWNKYVFGSNASMRGAQDAIIDQEVNANYISNLKTTDRDYKDYDTVGYKGKLDEQLAAALEKQSDPDMRERIMKAFTKNASGLARMHAQGRQVWEGVVQREAVKNTVVGAGDLLSTAYQSLDPKVKAEAEATAREALTNCKGMHAVPCQDVRVQAIIEDLGKHDKPELMGFAEKLGYLKNLTPLNAQRLSDARDVFNKNNSNRYANDMQELKNSIAAQDGTFENKAAASKALYGSAFNTNRWREANLAAAEVARQEKIAANQRATDLLTMSPDRFKQTTAELTKSFSLNMERLATDGVLRDRRNAEARAQESGEKLDFDPSKNPTKAEMSKWLQNNPIKIAAQWKNAQVYYPQLHQQASQVAALIRAPSLVQSQLDSLKPMMDNINVLKNTDPELFSKTFKNDQSTLDTFTAYDIMVNQENMEPRTALETLREQQKKPVPELSTMNPSDLEDGVENALERWQESAGDKWFFGWFEDEPENMAYAEEAMRGYYEEAWQAHKGDARQAEHGAYMRMLKHGSVAGGKFIVEGASLNTDIASADTLLRGWDNNNSFKNGINWQGAGFGVGQSMFDDGMTIRKGINGDISITGYSSRNGQLVHTTIPVARDIRDLAPTDDTQSYFYDNVSFHETSGASLNAEQPSTPPKARPPTPTSIPDALWQIGERILDEDKR